MTTLQDNAVGPAFQNELISPARSLLLAPSEPRAPIAMLSPACRRCPTRDARGGAGASAFFIFSQSGEAAGPVGGIFPLRYENAANDSSGRARCDRDMVQSVTWGPA
jgi:hypothetical protein